MTIVQSQEYQSSCASSVLKSYSGRRMKDYFEPPIEKLDIVLVDSNAVALASLHVVGCEGCSEDANTLFEWLFDEATGRDPSITDYLLEAPASCPRCHRMVTERTLVEVVK